MAEDEKPPSWVPIDQHVGQVPLTITTGIDGAAVPQAEQKDIHALAAQIIRDNQPIINRFVAMQRQQIEVGEKDIHNNVLPLKDLTVYYQNVQGLERMHYHIAPKVEAPPEIPEPSATPPEPPKPPTEEEKPPVPPDLRAPEPDVPEPEKPPEVEEPKSPEEEKLPEEEKPPEFEEPKPEEPEEPPKEEELPEEEEHKGWVEFLDVQVACFLPVEFGDGGD